MAISGELQSVSSTTAKGIHLSLLKFGPVTQTFLAAAVSALVLGSTALTVILVVTRANYDPPIANPDVTTLFKTTSVYVDVLANDEDTRGGVLTLKSVDKPTYGTAVIEEVADPKTGEKKQYVKYTAPLYYSGYFELPYTITNDRKDASSYIGVTIQNHPPEPVDFDHNINKNLPHTTKVFVDLNDKGLTGKDIDKDKMFVKSITKAPANGFAQITTDGQGITYTPNRDSLKNDDLTYEVSDYNATATKKLNIKFLMMLQLQIQMIMFYQKINFIN